MDRLRPTLAAAGLLIAVIMLCHGLALGGIAPGHPGPPMPEAATTAFVASAVMLVAAVTLRWSAGLAGLEMLLAGGAMALAADTAHRFILADGVAALLVAMSTIVVAVWNPRVHEGCRPPAALPPHTASVAVARPVARHLLRRIDAVRRRRAIIATGTHDASGPDHRTMTAMMGTDD